MPGLWVCFIVVPLVVMLAVLLWFMNRSMDEDRIRGWLEFRGNKLLGSQLLATKADWRAQLWERGYEVRYLDVDGHEHFATCVTGLFKGLVWTDDKFLRYADQVEGTPLPGKTDLKPDDLEAQNRRLREELERIKREGPH